MWLALNTLSLFTDSSAAKATKIDKYEVLNEYVEIRYITDIWVVLCAMFPFGHALPGAREASVQLLGNQHSGYPKEQPARCKIRNLDKNHSGAKFSGRHCVRK